MDPALRATLTGSRVDSRDGMNYELLTMVYPEHLGA